MPVFLVTSPDGKKYRVNGPEGSTQEEAIQYIKSQVGTAQQGQGLDFSKTPTAELEAAPSAPTSISDIARSLGIGVVGGAKAITDVFGAGSGASEYLGETVSGLQKGLTPARQAEIARRQELEKRAAESGDTFKEVKSFLGGVAEAPIQSLVQGVGSSAPTILASLAAIPAGAPTALALGVGVISRYALGAAQGVGELKGSILDEVEQAYIKSGYSKEKARELAVKAQEYSSDKAFELGGAALLGALDAFTGIESGVSKAARAAAAKKVAGEVVGQTLENLPEKALVRPTVSGSAVRSALGEAPLEGAQGGFGEYATNLALIKEGLLDPNLAMQGVFGAAARDAAIGALTGTAFTPVEQANRMREYQVDQGLRELQEQEKVGAIRKQIEEEEKPYALPGGFTIEPREVGRQTVPDSFAIMAEGREEPLSVVDTEEEAKTKLESLTRIRQEEQARLLEEEQKINQDLQKTRDRIDRLEATEQTSSEEYQSLKADLPRQTSEANEKIAGLYDQLEALSRPLSLIPIGETEKVQNEYVLKTATGKEFSVHSTEEDAIAEVKKVLGEEIYREKEIQRATLPQRAEFIRQLQKFGLGDVGLKIVDKIEGGAGGAYLNKLIQVAIDEPAPVQTMRHESLHALKDLGFFTPQQWKALEERAKKQWIKEHLEDQETEVNGERMSRLDGYRKLGYSEQDIIEEAIADAFGSYDKGALPPPGMIAALFKKLKNFFANLGQALRGAGFQSAEDIFQQVERGQLKPAAVETATAEKFSLPIMRGEEVPKFEAKEGEKPGKKVKPTLEGIAKYFDDQIKDQYGSKLDYNDKASFDRAVKIAGEEVAYQLQKEKSGLDWYEDDVKDAFKQTNGLIPELGKTDNRLLFSVMAGIMSPQTNARDNWFIASKAFEHYVDTGVIPGVNPETNGLWQGGTTSVNKKTQLEFLNRMINDPEMGKEKTLEWLFTDHPVKEINEFRSKYGNIKSGIDGKLTDIKPGLYAFGPKVGPFVSNLNGIHDVTVDMWMTRTFNRYFGTMLGPNGKIVDQPTEPQRRAIKALVNEVAKNAGIKPYQVQSLLWFYEQQLFTKMGVLSASYGFSDGAKKFVESGGRGRAPSVGGAAAPAKGKLSIKRGVLAEVAPNPDHIAADKWREMTPAERLDATKAVANKVLTPIFGDLGLKGYSFEFSSGKFEGEVNPNILIKAPKDASIEQLDEVARVVGYVLDQKSMVTFDEENTTSGTQAGFVKVVVPQGMTTDQLTSLREHIASEVPQADGDTLRNGELIYGNFSAYNDSVDTLTDDQYHQAIIDAVESFDYDGTILVSDPVRFHSDMVWPENRVGYLEGTRYGEDRKIQGGEGADVWRQGRRRLENLAEQAIVLRDRWIDARGAARLGGRERGDSQNFGEPTAEYGSPRADSVSAVGVHFSKEFRPELSSEFFGTGLRGMENERLSSPENSDLRNRLYFYVDTGNGIRPEAGVGGVPHVIKLNNLYDAASDPLRLIKDNTGTTSEERANSLERKIMDAGFDGMLVRDSILPQGYAILYGEHKVKTKDKLSLKRVAFPSVKEAKEAVKNSQISTDTEAFKQYNAGNQWVDSDGKPKVFYHATAHNFFEFTPAGQSQAIFLADTPEEAETFGSIAEDRLRRQIYKALNKDDKLDFFQRVVDEQLKKDKITQKEADSFMREAKRKIPEYGDFGDIEQEVYDALLELSPTRMSIMPLYARAMSPFDFENKDDVDRVLNWVANNTKIPQDFPDKWLAGMKGRISQGLWQAIEDTRVQQAIRALGFDAFTVRENRASPKNYAVYKPEQVKSATGNDGQFSLETKDIRFSLKNVRYSPERFDNLLSDSMYTQDGSENKTKGYLGFVNPMDFVRATSSDEMIKKLRGEQEPVDFAKMRELGPIGLQVSADKDGNWKITGHEGRHRMLALNDAGYRNVPIFMEFAGSVDDAKSIPTKAIKSQAADTVDQVLLVAEAEPLSFANKDKAMEKFTRLDSKVKYSLPSLSAQTTARMNEVAPQRYEPTWKERVIGAFKHDFTDLRQRFLNRYEALAVADRKLREKMRKAGGPELLADQSAEFAALQSDLAAGVAASSMGVGDRQGGVPVYRNGITTIDTSVKGLVESLAPLARYGDQEIYQRYQFWAGWKRGRRLLREGKEQLYTPADAKLAEEIERKHPEFVQVQKDLIAYNNGIVNFAVQTGVLSKERAQLYTQYADYIPFYRQLDLDKTIGPNPFSGISGVKGPKKLKGGESPLGDFMENMVRNTQSMINAGMKNIAAQRATKVASEINMVERMPGPVAGLGVDAYTVLENGQLVYYRSYDPTFIDALKSLNMPDLPFLGILSAPANALRNLVTKDPGFMLANLLRDSLSSYVTSGQNITPITGTMVNFGKALSGKDKNLQALFNAGVIGGYEFSQNVQQSGKSLTADLNKKAGKDAKLLRPFKSLWEGLEKGTTASDAATRMAIYERVMKETNGNEAEAISRALEVMNFNRKGSSVLIRIATAALPFFNARLQGLDLFYRASTGRMDTQDAQEIKRKFWVRGATMAALSAMYYMSVAGDDDYERQEDETKDNNWIFPALGIRIPIPFEVGTLFKTMPERITAYLMGNDTGKDLMESTARALANTFAFNPIPQTFKPLVEVATNYNFFTMRPIVGQGMQEIEPKYQVGPGTSKVAEYLGGLLNVSPMKLDQLIKGYTGTMGGYVVDVVDSMANQFADVPKASKRFEQMPVVKRFALDPEARGSVTDFYELQKSVDTFVRTANMLEKAAKPEEYAQYVQDNIGLLAVKDYVRDVEKSMKELRDMKKLISNLDMPSDEKRDLLVDLGRAESNLTANIKTIKKTVSQLK